MRYCVFPAYRELIDRWEPIVQRVFEPVPTAARPRITIRQTIDPSDVSQFVPEEERQTVEGGETRESEPLSYFETTDDIVGRPAWARGASERSAAFNLALAVARRTIGTSERRVTQVRAYEPADIAFFEKESSWPGKERNDPMPAVGEGYTQSGTCWTAGQAREAIALWLAARAVPGSEAALRYMLPDAWKVTVLPGGEGVAVEPKTSIGGFEPQGVAFTSNAFFTSWSLEGVRTALEMTSRPSGTEVGRVLDRDWATWIDATTPLERLQSALGVSTTSVATPDPAERPGMEHLGYPEFGPPMWRPPTCM